MLTQLHCLFLLCLTASVKPVPTPGRTPKVYNALITSNQNLEPSKAYPVYQPVIHDAALTFPLQSPFFYGGELSIGDGFIAAPAFLPKVPQATPGPPSSPSSVAPALQVIQTTEQPEKTPAPNTVQPQTESKSPEIPPPPPKTDSPIPLNKFGLPPQVIPLTSTHNSIPNLGHFTYTYPTLRFYDPFDPFSFHPYAGVPPLYHPLTNVLGQYESPVSGKEEVAPAPTVANQPISTPRPEPSDLNVLNYSPKDPEIANVPPPPVPQGGLNPDKSE